MITDKNILSSKHTKTEWHPIEYAGIWNLNDAPYYDANHIHSADDVGEETAKANAHMASAAPEAIEFIADFLQILQDKEVYLKNEELISRAECILKKAYNL